MPSAEWGLKTSFKSYCKLITSIPLKLQKSTWEVLLFQHYPRSGKSEIGQVWASWNELFLLRSTFSECQIFWISPTIKIPYSIKNYTIAYSLKSHKVKLISLTIYLLSQSFNLHYTPKIPKRRKRIPWRWWVLECQFSMKSWFLSKP